MIQKESASKDRQLQTNCTVVSQIKVIKGRQPDGQSTAGVRQVGSSLK